MARINFEEEAWTRVYRLADFMGCSVREAAGTVTCLWHQSQDLIKVFGTIEDIADWASLFQLSQEEKEKWISALKKSRFISERDSGLFEIHGNEIQIKNRASRINKASKGAKALMKKVKKLGSLEAGSKQAPSKSQAGFKALSAVQGSAVQSNAIQVSARQGNTDQVFSMWNENRGRLPKALKLTKKRKEKIKALREAYTDEEILVGIIRLSESDFCCGKNEKGWVADFDFLLQSETISKAMEGRYDNRVAGKPLSKGEHQFAEIAQYVANLED